MKTEDIRKYEEASRNKKTTPGYLPPTSAMSLYNFETEEYDWVAEYPTDLERAKKYVPQGHGASLLELYVTTEGMSIPDATIAVLNGYLGGYDV